MTETIEFRPVSLGDRALVEAACAGSGTLSCQYNFANLYCLREFYGTEISAPRPGVLFVRQTKREPGQTAYLPPLGANWDLLPGVAAADGRPWFVCGVTKDQAAGLDAGLFRMTADRDWAEYLYHPEKLNTLSGGDLAQKRKDARICRRLYGGRLMIEPMNAANSGEVARFQTQWYGARRSAEARHLAAENRAILCALEHFDALGLSGLVIRLDGRVAAFSYGSPLGSRIFDIIAQKADPTVRYLYRVLFQEFVKAYCLPFEYVNAEEDLGLSGLRALKMTYRPALLLEKWRAEPIAPGSSVASGIPEPAIPGGEGGAG